MGVDVGVDADDPQKYVERISTLRRCYSVVAFVPASPELYSLGQRHLGQQARELVEQAGELCAQAQCDAPAASGQTLYEALDAYAVHARQANPKESGR